MKRATVTFFAVAILAVIAGCESEQEAKLKRGVGFAKANIEKIGREPMATAAFQSMAEQGGDIQHYLVACARDPESLPGFCKDKPEAAWMVVLKEGPGPSDYTIEAYGEDTGKPLMTEVATISFKKPPVEKENINGEPGQDPPITKAAAQGDAARVQELIRKGADVNAMSVEGATGLMYAAAHGHPEVARLLLAANADVHLSSRNKDSWTALMAAVSGGRAEIVRMLLEKGADPNATQARAQTPLMNAAAKGHGDIVDLLLMAGAQINAKEQMAGNSALSLAISKGHPDIATKLVAAGADVDHVANNGLTDLMLAASMGQKDIVQLLISKGVNTEARDPNGNTAVRYAEHGGFTEIAALLKGLAAAPAAAPAAKPEPAPSSDLPPGMSRSR
ncbi:MAG TPA: ankyrin repeat domain-containing protein [Luteolibacter sp.]|nr:ankyrin repeat domain-containing protein [Luteolibacter sp.]